jgi:uncharacterized repeat protein (TIGR01451 family)
MRHQIAILLLSLSFLSDASAQCNVNTINDILTTCSNSSVTVGAYPYTPGVFTLLFDFNNALPAGWQSTGGVTFTSPCGPTGDTSSYFWASTSVGTPSVTTNTINTSCGGEIMFDLVYAIQGGPVPCEGPDELDEGVLIQYSIDNGVNWFDIVYFVPDGTFTNHPVIGDISVAFGPTPFTDWHSYSFPLPYGAISGSTLFRWIQINSSGGCCDNWGLDNIKFNDNNCSNNIITWGNGSTNNNITVTPTSDTTIYFEVFDSLGVSQCIDSILIDVLTPGFDNLVNLVNGNFITGQQTNTTIHAENLGCEITSGTISLVIDSLTTYISANPAPDSVNGDTLLWNYSNLSQPNGSHFTANLTLLTSINAQVGDSIHLDLQINATANDIDSSNNTRNYQFPVLNGYDPNDKKVYPIGVCNPHFVYNNEKLTYTIRFQNTGNSFAYNIKLLDSLSPFIKKESLRILGSSHPVSVHFDYGDVLRFNFDSINLQHANYNTSNPNASIGYVIFEFEQNLNLTHGSEITNKAEIYFDYNPPITTNWVFNTVTDGSHISDIDTLVITALDSMTWNNQTYNQNGLYAFHSLNQYGCDSVSYLNLDITSLGLTSYSFDFSIHPNPSKGKIQIQSSKADKFELEIISLDGKSLVSTSFFESLEIDLSFLSAGTYLVSCKSADSKITKRIVIQ